MADAAHAASGTADVQLVTGAGKLTGYSAHESGTVATATSLRLRDGTDATGTPLVFVELAADASSNVSFAHPIEFHRGLFLDRAATGESEITVYVA
jgi:hypothetical protein